MVETGFQPQFTTEALQRRYGLTYKEARVYLAGSGRGVNARLAEEFGVGVHAIYNLRRRAREKIGASDPNHEDGAVFCDVLPAGASPMDSPTLRTVSDGDEMSACEYAVEVFRLQELAGLTFQEAQAYMCSLGWETRASLRGRTGLSEEQVDGLIASAEDRVRERERRHSTTSHDRP